MSISLAHKLVTNAVEWFGVGKAVGGGIKVIRGIGGLLGRVRGTIYPAQRMLNSSYRREAGWRAADFAADEGISQIGEGAALWGLSKASSEFADALNSGAGTLKYAYRVRDQLDAQLRMLNRDIQSEMAAHRMGQTIERLNGLK